MDVMYGCSRHNSKILVAFTVLLALILSTFPASLHDRCNVDVDCLVPNTTCKLAGCFGQTCICEPGYYGTPMWQSCKRAKFLGEECAVETDICVGQSTFCYQGTCRCFFDLVSVGDGYNCVPKTPMSRQYSFLNGTCDGNGILCWWFDQICYNNTCVCKDGMRPATREELLVQTNEYSQCRPMNYTLDSFYETCLKEYVPISGVCTYHLQCPKNALCKRVNCQRKACVCSNGYISSKDKSSCIRVLTDNEKTENCTNVTTVVKANANFHERCTVDTDCAILNTECKYTGCDGKTCLCKSGHYFSSRTNSCKIAKFLGERCSDSTDICIGSRSFCHDGVCRCYAYMESAGDGYNCIPVWFRQRSYSFLNLSCNAINKTCWWFDQICVDGKCACEATLRPATREEQFSYVNDYSQCRPENYSLDTFHARCLTGYVPLYDTCTYDQQCPEHAIGVWVDCQTKICACADGYWRSDTKDICEKVVEQEALTGCGFSTTDSSDSTLGASPTLTELVTSMPTTDNPTATSETIETEEPTTTTSVPSTTATTEPPAGSCEAPNDCTTGDCPANTFHDTSLACTDPASKCCVDCGFGCP